jgi:hypothetical protein
MSLRSDEIKSYYEFKVLSSLLKKKYPFVLGIELTPDYNDYDTVLFLSLVVDYDKFINDYLNVPYDKVDHEMIERRNSLGIKDRGGNIHIPNIFFLLSDVDAIKKSEELTDDVNDAVKKVRRSDALDREHKIPYYHSININDYSFPMNTYKKEND